MFSSAKNLRSTVQNVISRCRAKYNALNYLSPVLLKLLRQLRASHGRVEKARDFGF